MAVTVSYYIRSGGVSINGSATPPTAAQAQQTVKQSALVVFGVTADAQARFTHNWGLDVSSGFYYEPEIMISQISDTTSAPSLTIDWALASNVITINKSASNAPVTVLVTLRKPHSIGQ